jgi:hypothetical protein
MAYEYEKRNKGVILTGTIFDEGDLEKQPAFEEVKEVYAKAKAFNGILSIDLDQHEIIVHGQVEDIVNKYMEDK